MLYPDFNELVALKARKIKLAAISSRLVKATPSGSHHSPFRGQGLKPDSLRQYVFGDDLRAIDWRATARTGMPHVKVFKEERQRQMVLCIDVNSSMRFGTKKTFKSVQAARIAAFLGWKSFDEHDSVGACLFGAVSSGIKFFQPKRTRNSFCSLLKELSSSSKQESSASLSKALEYLSSAAPQGSLVYIISDFLELDTPLEAEKNLARLCKKADVIFIAINDSADRSLSPVGMLGFFSKVSEQFYFNTDSLQGREAYECLWKKNRDNLKALTARFKIPLIELTTESEIQRDLSIALRSIAKRKRR